MGKRVFRIGLLIGVIAFAIGWMALLSIGADPAGAIATNTTTSSGDTISIRFIDQAGFPPRITTFLKITDKAGNVIRNLPAENFSLTEDGSAVEIKEFIGAGDQPLTVILVIDTSGSMAEQGKMQGAQDAAVSFLDNAKPDVDSIGVISFSNDVRELGPLKRVSQGDLEVLKAGIRSLVADGSTEFYAATREAIDRLKEQPGRRAVIALTDGQDNSQQCLIFCPPDSFDSMLKAAKDAEVTLYTIGLGSDLAIDRMRQMAYETNGEFYQAPTPAQLTELYRTIATGLADEYSLGYDSPTPRRDGTRRAVQVNVKLPGGATIAAGSYSVPGVLTANSNAPLFLGLLIPLLALMGLPPLLRRLPGRRGPQAQAGGDMPAIPQSPTIKPPEPVVAPSAQTMNTTPCPKCATPTKLTARFCAECGHQVDLCPNCGKQLSKRGAKFCGSCGYRTP